MARNIDPKVVILCGGMGTRLREETEFKPKPMVNIGEYPMLWHIMKIYGHYGFNDFVLCLGYKGDMIKNYFLNYQTMVNDFTISLNDHGRVDFHNSLKDNRWNITMINTGLKNMTGSRLKKIEKYIDGGLFFMTYGDGIANINIKELLSFHRAHRKTATITGVHPQSRFGELETNGSSVFAFTEKPQIQQGLINGGFFVFDRRIFDYLSLDEDCVLEKEPLEALAHDGELMVYQHKGYWRCMDTYRDVEHLNQDWASPDPAWKIWRD